VRDRASGEIAALSEAFRRLRYPATVRAALSPSLAALKETLT
jgi:hypothetical protein